MAGRSQDFFSGLQPNDVWLVKTDLLGNIEWSRTYGGSHSDEAYSLIQMPDGGYAMAGSTISFGAGNYDFYLVKTDAYGNLEWNQTYGGAEFEAVHSLVETFDGGYAMAGRTKSFGSGGNDFYLVKTDSNGNMLWDRTYGGEQYDSANSIIVTSDGGYAIAGGTSSFGSGDTDFWLIKTDEYGNIPEFPSWIILPLFLTATLVIVFFRKSLKKSGNIL